MIEHRFSINNRQSQSTIGNLNQQSTISINNRRSQSSISNRANPQSSIRNRHSVLAQRSHLYPCVVEASAAAKIGQRIGHQGVGCESVIGALPPQSFWQRHRARTDVWVQGDRALHFAAIVEHAHGIVGRQAANLRIRLSEFMPAGSEAGIIFAS